MLVLDRYCSDACQQEHRLHHEAMCKEWAAELRDEIYLGSRKAPILVIARFAFCPLIFCCSTLICVGCFRAEKCPLCRHPVQAYKEFYDKDRTNRIEANDPVAMREMGATLYHEEDYEAATDYWTKTKAAE